MRFSGTTMWKPFEPDVLTAVGSPRSSSRSRSPSAAVRSGSGSSSAGSRSKTQTSGRSASGIRDVHTWSVTVFWLAIHWSERASLASG